MLNSSPITSSAKLVKQKSYVIVTFSVKFKDHAAKKADDTRVYAFGESKTLKPEDTAITVESHSADEDSDGTQDDPNNNEEITSKFGANRQNP